MKTHYKHKTKSDIKIASSTRSDKRKERNPAGATWYLYKVQVLVDGERLRPDSATELSSSGLLVQEQINNV